ncbi:hypothetical protein K3495_g12785 [Podosphaera aphanis]|nr:hypothetical protein K3495_g12785 [Podosphaera aphanis]
MFRLIVSNIFLLQRISNFLRLRSTWSERERAEATVLGTVQVRWIPGHQGIAGNERVDALAKEASGLPTEITEATIARSKTILEKFYQERLTLYLNQHAPRRYLEFGIKMNSQLPPEISLLPRRSLGRLLAARSGHGDFAEYHRRFKHTDADLYCSCGQEKSPEHPFSCHLLSRSCGRLRNSTRQNQSDIVKILARLRAQKHFINGSQISAFMTEPAANPHSLAAIQMLFTVFIFSFPFPFCSLKRTKHIHVLLFYVEYRDFLS